MGSAMTLKDRERSPASGRMQVQTSPPRVPGAFLSRLAAIEGQATPLRLRQRQRITLAPAQEDLVFAVQSGVLMSRLGMPGNDTGLITVYFPGDVIVAGGFPCLAERTLVAATPSETLRLKSKPLMRLLASDQDLLAAYDRQRDRQQARAMLHAVILATLDGPQRLAAFLTEMALEVGVSAGTAVSIELPLSRTEIARYLALNADTLSRLMSRFKADGLVAQKSRHQITLRNWRALCDLCPIAPAILAIERNRPSPLT
jgi:CRP/FNR family transcriptional regulator